MMAAGKDCETCKAEAHLPDLPLLEEDFLAPIAQPNCLIPTCSCLVEER